MSNTPKDGGPAFPVADFACPNGQVQRGATGMTLRAYFAASALAGLCARDLRGAGEGGLRLNNHVAHAEVRGVSEAPYLALTAVRCADALIAELAKGAAQ